MTPVCTRCGKEVCECRKPLVHIPGHDNLPSNLSPEERQAAADPGIPAAALEKPMEQSPTGTPIVPPHTIGFKVMGVLMAVAAAVALKQPDLLPDSELDQQIATVLMAIIGFVSPGLRRK
jgi:hypothetical protein